MGEIGKVNMWKILWISPLDLGRFPCVWYPMKLRGRLGSSPGGVSKGDAAPPRMRCCVWNDSVSPNEKLLVRIWEGNEPPPCLSQEKSQIQKDLWRIEDVIAGLSANKENFRILVESVKNPGEQAIFLESGLEANTQVCGVALAEVRSLWRKPLPLSSRDEGLCSIPSFVCLHML